MPKVEGEADEGFRAFRAEARAKVNAAVSSLINYSHLPIIHDYALS